MKPEQPESAIQKRILIIISNERPKSWNEFYSGKHWGVRDLEAKRTHQLIKAYCKRNIMDGLVDIELTVFFDKRPYDADNVCAKFYIDGLKGVIIKNDSPKFVRSVKTICLIDRLNPRIEIEVIKADRP